MGGERLERGLLGDKTWPQISSNILVPYLTYSTLTDRYIDSLALVKPRRFRL